MLKDMFAKGLMALALLAPFERAGAQETQSAPPLASATPAPPVEPPSPARFAPEIAHFAELDAHAPPPPCGFLFVGSSSIRLWRSLDGDMAPLPVLNRGFGGARIADVDYYFDQVVTPYRPRAIVFYAGENDLWAGVPADMVVADFQRFLELKSARLGDTPVYFVSLKPSRQRVSQLPLQAEVNARVRAMTAERSDLFYVDVVPAMLEQGAPKDIFVADGLHMTPAGYLLWTGVVRPVLEHDLQAGRACPAPATLNAGH
jgi:lysophospholipase L1-like esterase